MPPLADHLFLLPLGVIGSLAVLVHRYKERVPPPWGWLRATILGIAAAFVGILLESLFPGGAEEWFREGLSALVCGFCAEGLPEWIPKWAKSRGDAAVKP